MLSSGFYIGDVINVNPLEYSVEVRVPGLGNSRTIQTVVASPLAIHGGYSSKTIGISLPEIGSIVMVVVPFGIGSSDAYILGYVKEPSSRDSGSASSNQEDPLALAMSPNVFFRGQSPSDVLPGDFVVESSGGSKFRVSSGPDITIGSSKSGTTYTTVLGKGTSLSKFDELFLDTPLMDLAITSESALLQGNVNDSSLRNVVTQDGNIANDFKLEIGGPRVFSLEYTGSTVPALFSINKEGEIVIKGSKVTIDSSNRIKRADGFDEIPTDWKTEVKGDTVLLTEQYTLNATGDVEITTSGNLDMRSGGDTVEYVGGLYKKVVAGTSAIKNAPLGLVSGFNDAMVFECDSGSVAITAGSSLIPSIAKSQIRLESNSGGDIILQSKLSAGGLGTTGSIVLSSAVPASTTLAGGLFNYGIALNSPLCMLGNTPGVDLSGPGLPNAFLPPIPLVPGMHDRLVKHAPLVLTLTSLATALSAVPVTAPAGAALTSAIAATLISMPTTYVYGA
jgi:hypothetical protein